MMKTVILCGGFGTRLREETEFRPKPLVEVGNRPILWHIMKIYEHYGLSDFVVCLGYRGNMIKDYFLNYDIANSDFTISLGAGNDVNVHESHNEHFRVTLAETGLDTMTGGRIKRIEKYVDSDTFMVTYGDVLADINLGELLSFHRNHGRLATVTVTRPFSRFGMLGIEKDGLVTRFEEKPQLEGWTSAGFFVFDKRVLQKLGGNDCVLEKDVLPSLARDAELYAYNHNGFFYAMDTYREYKYLNDLWNNGAAPWKIWPD